MSVRSFSRREGNGVKRVDVIVIVARLEYMKIWFNIQVIIYRLQEHHTCFHWKHLYHLCQYWSCWWSYSRHLSVCSWSRPAERCWSAVTRCVAYHGLKQLEWSSRIPKEGYLFVFLVTLKLGLSIACKPQGNQPFTMLKAGSLNLTKMEQSKHQNRFKFDDKLRLPRRALLWSLHQRIYSLTKKNFR